MAWRRTALLRIAAIVLVVGHASPLLTGLILLALGLWAVRLHPRKTLDMSPLAVFSFGTLWMLPGLGEGFVWSTQEYNVLNEENASKVG
jgi:apolipoprotein N-acyltransferase